MKRILLGILSILPLSTLAGWSFHSETIKDDEQILFFPAEAYPAADGKNWQVRFHAWVFEPETLGEINGMLRKALGIAPDESGEQEKHYFRQRGQWFLVDNERGKRVVIQLGKHQFRLDKTAANGHARTTVTIPVSLLSTGHGQAVTYRAVLRRQDKRNFLGTIHIIPGTGISVISDIDDTIKISNVTQKSELLANTFLRPFRAVPGLPDIYRGWKDGLHASFHYVSASPWQLYPPLAEFITQTGYPAGLFYMKNFRLKDSSFFNLFSDPVTYKTGIIETLFRRYPKRKFILVGDSGEKDPEVYGAIARKYPGQILKILIRKLGENNALERYRMAFAGVPENSWLLFSDPAEIRRLDFR